MALSAEGKILGNTARTQYVSVPARVVNDDQYMFRPGDGVLVAALPGVKVLVIAGGGTIIDQHADGSATIYPPGSTAPPKETLPGTRRR